MAVLDKTMTIRAWT